jgi:transposase
VRFLRATYFPLHRQAKIFSRFGVELSDRTMCGWMEQCAGLLDPLYKTLKDFVLSSKVVGTDDTPVKVLDRKLPQTRQGRIWPYVGDRDHPAVIYDYTPTRERAGPEEFLKGFRGHLQADAYVVYDSFFTDPARGMVEVGCWAHYLESVVIRRESVEGYTGRSGIEVNRIHTPDKCVTDYRGTRSAWMMAATCGEPQGQAPLASRKHSELRASSEGWS